MSTHAAQPQQPLRTSPGSPVDTGGAEGLRAELRRQASSLPAIPHAAVRAFASAGRLLVKRVESLLANDPAFGGNPPAREVSAVRDRRDGHAALMAMLFEIDLGAIVRVLPWAYLSSRSHGIPNEAIVREHLAWARAVELELEPDDAEPLRAVYRWMADRHEALVELAEMPDAVGVPADLVWHDRAEPFLEAMLAGDERRFGALVEEAIDGGGDLAALYADALRPALYRVGHLWETGQITVAHEHLATSLVARGMALLYERLPAPPVYRGRAIVAPAPGEGHAIGGRMLADLLELDGWDARHLGSDLPAEDVVDYTQAVEADILAVSLAIPFHLTGAVEMIQSLRAAPGGEATKIAVGGLAFDTIPELEALVPADGVASDAAAAVDMARRWWEGSA